MLNTFKNILLFNLFVINLNLFADTYENKYNFHGKINSISEFAEHTLLHITIKTKENITVKVNRSNDNYYKMNHNISGDFCKKDTQYYENCLLIQERFRE